MLDTIFKGIFDSDLISVISVSNFLLCVGVSLLIGIFHALVYCYKSCYSKGFVITLAMLPAMVCVVIMMVNGNVGTGVAVAGAFSLVRFRSLPGTARDIGMIFMAMGAGLIAGMGYLAYAVLFSLILGGVLVLFNVAGLGNKRGKERDKTLRITIPEDLDYSDIFEDLMQTYTTASEIVAVKTTNLGSLFKLTYNITLKDAAAEKQFIDALRCRNGNLEISISRQEAIAYEL